MLGYEPGLKYAYSNVGYLVLGRIIEKLSGMDYHQYVRSNIFEKLNIPAGDLDFDIPDDELHATGYEKRISFINMILGLFIDKKKFTSKPAKKWKAYHPFLLHGTSYGGLTGNVNGLMIYLKDLLSEKPSVLSPASRKSMLEKQKTSDESESGTTLGWFTGSLNGNEYFCHAGGGGGYYSEIRIYPALKTASAVCMNKSSMRDIRFLDKTDKRLL